MQNLDSTNSSATNSDAPIAFLDSGVGGLPYLERARDFLPNENFFYVADRANFPYGLKSSDQVRSAVLSLVDRILAKERPKAFVLACNTMSVVALEKLRKLHPGLPFVGVVPAIKPAAERTAKKRIGVFATNRTLQDAYVDDLIRKFASSCEIVRVAGPGIVDFVETKLFFSTADDRKEVIIDAARTFKARGVDKVVLGCTHFLYVRDELHAELGDGVEIIDSREGVVKQLLRVLDSRRLRSARKVPGAGRFYLTGPEAPEKQYYGFADRFRLELAGTM